MECEICKKQFNTICQQHHHYQKSNKQHCDFVKSKLNIEYKCKYCGKKFNTKFDMVDINNTAVKLSKENLIKNNVQKNANVFYSDGFSSVESMYDFIVTNPPIKTGKKLLFDLMQGAYDHLNDGGQLVLVIRKDHGMESLKKHIISVFGNCEIIERDKGFYILKAVK